MAMCLRVGDEVEPMWNETKTADQLDPLQYPWDPPEASGVVHGDDFLPLRLASDLNAVLFEANAAPLDARSLVVSIGSNSSPDVMRRKLANYGQPVSRILPMVRGQILNIGLGHSAHVSKAGYIPAAPYFQAGECATVWVSWLDERQLAALDETEPNYRRIQLSGGACPLVLETGERPGTFSLFTSRWGVLTDGNGVKLPFLDQQALFRRLAAIGSKDPDKDPDEAKYFFEGPPERVVERLVMPSVEAGVREWFRAAGLGRVS
jgi:hypothetical protein